MENLKIKVNNEAESKEAQELFFELGYQWAYRDIGKNIYYEKEDIFLYADKGGKLGTGTKENQGHFNGWCGTLVSLPELRALVSLHKNPINMDKVLSEVRSDALGLLEDKEWLNTKTYEYKKAVDMGGHNKWIEIPEGAELLVDLGDLSGFYKNNFKQVWDQGNWKDTVYNSENLKIWNKVPVLWQRHTQPEELPFVDDLPNFLFEDTVNHPSHYASGEIECIDAIESSMTHEAFCGYLKGNVQKYMWRYENKGGLESLEKAQWYLNKLISRIS